MGVSTNPGHVSTSCPNQAVKVTYNMCSHEHHTLPSEIVDPTLQSCCERDREQQRTIEEYKQTLLRDDPTQTRQNITRDAVVRDVDRLQASLHSESSSDDDDIVGRFISDSFLFR